MDESNERSASAQIATARVIRIECWMRNSSKKLQAIVEKAYRLDPRVAAYKEKLEKERLAKEVKTDGKRNETQKEKEEARRREEERKEQERLEAERKEQERRAGSLHCVCCFDR